MLRDLVLSIPSPGEWGRQWRLYGLMIAFGIIAGLELARKRWADRGGNPDDMYSIAMWAVPAGLVGARLYHVVTDNQLYRGHWFDNPLARGANSPLAIWQGGLGIPGGIACGVGVGVWVGYRKGIRLPIGLDTVAPGIALAQAIGRWGNYFNVELFGRPTTLPWGLEVPAGKAAQEGYPPGLTYHPTFLYESLWNIGLVVFLLWIDKKRVLRPGRIFALYIGGYFAGRLWVEALRSDSANKILGLRVNIWMSLLAVGGVALFLAIAGLKRRPDDSYEPYRDGHRFDLVRHDVDDAGADDAGADGADNTDEAEADRDAAPDAGATATATGTRARRARQRASGGSAEKSGGEV